MIVPMKLNASLGVYERMEISGEEASTAIGSYPAMTIIESKVIQRKLISTGEVIHESYYVVDYEGSLTPELVQALAEKWGLKIVWRRKVYLG